MPKVGVKVCLWAMSYCNAWAMECRILPSALQGHLCGQATPGSRSAGKSLDRAL